MLLPIPDVIPANLYYLSMLLPAGAALASLLLARVPIYVRTAILAVFAVGAIHTARPLYEPDRMPYDLGSLLRSLTQPGDLLATESGGNPNVLYYADRRGWMMENEYNIGRVGDLQRAGARYYANTFLGAITKQPEFFRALDRKYQRLSNDDAPWQVYDLAATPGPLRIAREDTAGVRTANFDDQIQFQESSIRPLKSWPNSFEVVNYWKCLKTLTSDLRISIDVTNAAGETVAEHDHSPQGGLFPTSKWSSGDIIRDRHILVLPPLAAGKYQIRVSWLDPLQKRRLLILNPVTSAQADRASVAEVGVQSSPRDSWFSPN